MAMMKNNSRSLVADFTKGSVSRQLVLFATPLFLSNLLQIAYNMVDMVIVGRYCGKVGLSGVSIGGDVANCMAFIAMGFSNAGQVIISQYLGAGQRDRVGRFIGTMCSFLLVSAALISVLCLVFVHDILRLMSTPTESWDATYAYATTCLFGLVFIYGYNMVSAILRGFGDSKHPFIFVSIAAILNVLFDLLFVIGFEWGTFGAALATVIAQAVSFISAAIFIWRRRSDLGISLMLRDFIYIDPAMLSTFLKLGIPMAIKGAAIHFSKLFVNSWINSYGVVVSAVAGIANKFGSISNLFSSAINTAASSMVGQNIGAEKFERVPRIMMAAFTIATSIAAFMSLLLLTWPHAIFNIFTTEADVLAVCMQYLPIAILVFFGSAARSPMNALINGSGHYIINFVVAILDGFVFRIGFALLLGLHLRMGYMGFWYGDTIANFTPVVIGLVFYMSGRWRTHHVTG